VAAVVGGTARTVGTVAGAAVAAPLTIVEQPLRPKKAADVDATLRVDPESKPLTP
jgi:ABC-type branched-subunit amino acid transport system permease subunit